MGYEIWRLNGGQASINERLAERAVIDAAIAREKNQVDLVLGGFLAAWTLPVALPAFVTGTLTGTVVATAGTASAANHACGLPIGLAGGDRVASDYVVDGSSVWIDGAALAIGGAALAYSVGPRVVSRLSSLGSSGASAAERGVGGSLPKKLGQAGEIVSASVTGLPKNTLRIPSASGARNYRVPDHLEPLAQRYAAETKNVNYQTLTSQILDDVAHVNRSGYPGRVDDFR